MKATFQRDGQDITVENDGFHIWLTQGTVAEDDRVDIIILLPEDLKAFRKFLKEFQ